MCPVCTPRSRPPGSPRRRGAPDPHLLTPTRRGRHRAPRGRVTGLPRGRVSDKYRTCASGLVEQVGADRHRVGRAVRQGHRGQHRHVGIAHVAALVARPGAVEVDGRLQLGWQLRTTAISSSESSALLIEARPAVRKRSAWRWKPRPRKGVPQSLRASLYRGCSVRFTTVR